MKDVRIYTIGHSNRSFDEFAGLLKQQDISLVVDVRSIPKSRANPQYGSEVLARELKRSGIDYVHMLGLGGFRKPRPDSFNKAWRNSSFRGYADYMQTPDFTHNLESLIEYSKRQRLAVMCAEAVPWRCHRSLIADALVAQNEIVFEILSKTSVRPHKLTSFATVQDGQVTYPISPRS